MNTVKKIYYFRPDQFNYFESWLEDMAEQGLFLKEQKSFACEFETGEPTRRKYRVIPINITGISKEERSMYEDAGWNYVPSKGQSVFCNENPDATELFTDVDSWRNRTRKYRRNRIVGFSIILVLWTACFVLSILNSRPNWDFGSAHTFDIEIVIFVCALLCFIGLIGLLTSDVIGIIDLIHKTGDTTIEHDLPYRKVLNRGRLLYVVGIALIVSIAALFLYSWDAGILNLKDSLAYENPDLVRFSEFDENTWDSYYDLIRGEEEAGDYTLDYHVGTETTLIRKSVHEELYIDRLMEDSENDDMSDYEIITYYSMSCSKFHDEETADRFLNEDIAYDSTWDDDSAKAAKSEDIAIDCDGVDYAGYYRTKDPKVGGNQTLYLRKGKKLIEVYYTGDKDLKDEIDVFVSKLQ